MALPHWATSVLGSSELWSAVAGCFLAAAARQVLVHAGVLPREAWVSMVLVAGLVAGTAAAPDALLLAVTFAVALVVSDRDRPAEAELEGVALSLMAAGAVYACLPDTEVALAVLGAVATTGGVTLGLQLRWHGAAWTTTAALVAATIADGQARATAVIGGMAIAAVHLLVTLRCREPLVSRGIVVAVVATALLVCSRVAGRGTSEARSAVIATLCVVVVAVVVVDPRRSASGPGERVGPPAGDD